MERLQKIIAESGYASRRKAEELIKKGKVVVNGKVVSELGTKASFSDDILVEGKKIEREEKEYYIFNKPRGVITSTSDDKGRSVVTDYFGSNNLCVYVMGVWASQHIAFKLFFFKHFALPLLFFNLLFYGRIIALQNFVFCQTST